jgi:hypothetical protein
VDVVEYLFPALASLESVRCLECGDVYGKPSLGDTVARNPGCPSCGYSGWIPVNVPTERTSRFRSAVGRPQLQLVRKH